MQRSKVGDRLHYVGEKLRFESLFHGASSNEKVICRAVFESLIAAEAIDILARSDDRLREREFHAVQLPSRHNPSEEIGGHGNGLKFLQKRDFLGGSIKASR